MNATTSDLQRENRTALIVETPSFFSGTVLGPQPGYGPRVIQDFLRVSLLRWLNAVYRVSKFLKKSEDLQAEDRVHVYDIFNAGPRHRFATAQFIVSNCGYGMGAAKYTSYANVSAEEAEAVVTGFRKSNPKVVGLWRRLDNLIASAARDKTKQLALELPSGEFLNHYNIRTSGKGYESFVVRGDFGHNSKQPRLWGGTLTENVTQRMARDVMANAVVNLEAAGLRVAFHVHDEVILEIPEGLEEQAKAEAYRILTQSPDWAPDLPLAVEGDFAEAYTK